MKLFGWLRAPAVKVLCQDCGYVKLNKYSGKLNRCLNSKVYGFNFAVGSRNCSRVNHYGDCKHYKAKEN